MKLLADDQPRLDNSNTSYKRKNELMKLPLTSKSQLEGFNLEKLFYSSLLFPPKNQQKLRQDQ